MGHAVHDHGRCSLLMRHRVAIIFFVLLLAHRCPAASISIFQCGFEADEGYTSGQTLAHQLGWLSEGGGGSGITVAANQQAFIGMLPPASSDDGFTLIWMPLGIESLPFRPLVRFTVDMTIVDSIGILGYDRFGWAVYNQSGQELFELGFDNESSKIYTLSGEGIRSDTAFSFGNGDPNGPLSQLTIAIDFGQNSWNATLNGADLHINKPISTSGATLDLGDIDAFWQYKDPIYPGDNYMLFDNYNVASEPRVWVEALSATNGQFKLRVHGDDGAKYAVETATSLPPVRWTPVRTNTVVSGVFDFVDPMPSSSSARFYRVRGVK
jgi:hypothetical protein